MPEQIYMEDTGSNDDAYVYKISTTSWADARDATSGIAVTGNSYSNLACGYAKGAGRGGGTEWRVHRTFMQFDTRSVTVLPRTVSLKIYGRGSSPAGTNFYVVESNGHPNIGNSDFDAIKGWTTGVSNLNNVIHYIGASALAGAYVATSSWNNSNYNKMELNQNAASAMFNNKTLQICIISANDLLNVTPIGTVSNFAGMHYSEYPGTSRDPFIEYIPGSDSIYFGTNF